VKVLHVNAGNLFGGIETGLLIQARERARCPGLEPSFAFFFEGRLSRELRETGAPLNMLGAVRVRYPWTILGARRCLAAAVDRERPDVVVTHSPWAHAIAAPVVKRSRVTLAHWLHSAEDGSTWLERWARRTPPDFMIANSAFTARASTIWKNVPTTVVYYPIAPRAPGVPRARMRELLETEPGAVVIVVTCRLERWKGHLSLVQALELMKDNPLWVAWIAGGPQRPCERAYLDEIRDTVARAGVASRVRFLGQRSDVPDVLGAADVHCQPNEGPEAFGIAFIEALLAGLPVVTTNMGAAPEIVDEASGILVPKGAAALSAALTRLVNEPALRERLGTHGRIRALELCDPARQFETLLATLESGHSAATAHR
jgi:glycosyltransferase involved in cell wall biosynthesis